MPVYEYHCLKCMMIFEELILFKSDISKYSNEHECGKCKSMCKRVPSASNFQFKGLSEGDPSRKGNSGIHDLDYPSLDKAIGRSSNRKWKAYGKMNEQHNRVRRESGSVEISVDSSGNVFPTDTETLKIRRRALGLFKKAKSNG